MEVAQDGGQTAHVVGVGVGEGNRVEMADSARPEDFRDDFFADVEILRGLVRATAKAAAIDEERFAVGCDEEDGVSLSHVDGFDEESVVGVIDGVGKDYGDGGEDEGEPGELARPWDSTGSEGERS
jgi:hypothetical protein